MNFWLVAWVNRFFNLLLRYDCEDFDFSSRKIAHEDAASADFFVRMALTFESIYQELYYDEKSAD